MNSLLYSNKTLFTETPNWRGGGGVGWRWGGGTDLPLAAVGCWPVLENQDSGQEREAQSATILNKATVPVRKLATSSAYREQSEGSV